MKTRNRKISTKKCGRKSSRIRKSRSVNSCMRNQHGGVIPDSLIKLFSDLFKRIKKFFSMQSLRIKLLDRKVEYIEKRVYNSSFDLQNIEKFEGEANLIHEKIEKLENEEKDMIDQYRELDQLATSYNADENLLQNPDNVNNFNAFVDENKNIQKIISLRYRSKELIDFIEKLKHPTQNVFDIFTK